MTNRASPIKVSPMAKIAIAGASGFVGKNLISSLKGKHSIRALGRRKPASSDSSVEWKETELFSASSTLEALKDVDVAIY